MITARLPWLDDEPEEIIPPCPEDLMPDRELERLGMEIQYLIDKGAFKPGELDLDEIDQLDLEAAIRILCRE